MESSALVRNTVHGLYLFCKQLSRQNLVPVSESELDARYRLLEENWEHVWPEVRDWLSRTDLVDKRSALSLFAQRFSNHIGGLDHSIALHEDLWNTVFGNLREARRLILASQ